MSGASWSCRRYRVARCRRFRSEARAAGSAGYVVPALSGELSGELSIGDERIDLAGGSGYHDHNWGFWEGVTWRWGPGRERRRLLSCGAGSSPRATRRIPIGCRA